MSEGREGHADVHIDDVKDAADDAAAEGDFELDDTLNTTYGDGDDTEDHLVPASSNASSNALNTFKDENESLKYAHPIHRRIYEALINSFVLDANHVQVRNESYWYDMRKKMGTKRHAALIVKQNTNPEKWYIDAYINTCVHKYTHTSKHIHMYS